MVKKPKLFSASSFFIRVLAALLLVNLASTAVLIYIAFTFSRDSLSNQAKESIQQQVSIFAESLENERLKSMLTIQKAIEKNQDLEEYLQVSEAEKIILARRIEKHFVQVQKDNLDIAGLYFFDQNGELTVAARNQSRVIVSPGRSLVDYDAMLEYVDPLFEQLRATPLVLSSGNMEWFIPPREASLSKPYQREDGNFSLLSGLAKLDKSTGLFGGMLLVHFKLDSWLEDLDSMKIQDQSPVWVYAQDKTILREPGSNLSNTQIFNPEKLLPSDPVLETTLIEDPQGLVALRDIPLNDLSNNIRLVLSVPESLLLQGLDPALEFFSWVLVISIFLLVGISYFISRILVRPFDELAVARNKLVSAQKLARLGHWEWDRVSKTIRLSENAAAILGLASDQTRIDFNQLLAMVHHEDKAILSNLITNASDLGSTKNVEYRLHNDGEALVYIYQTIDVFDRDDSRITGTIQDTTERRQSEAKIRELAYHDSVTGLANRSQFAEVAEDALIISRMRKTRMGVIFLDLDQFKQVNDTLGHDAGDELLKQVGSRLVDSVRPSDMIAATRVEDNHETMIARFGGDEFIILLQNLINIEDAIVVAERIQNALGDPFEINGKEVLSGGSLGISIYPDHGETINELLRLADTAMYKAKSLGRHQHVLYSSDIDSQHQNRLSTEVGLRRALKNEEFELYYQPRWNIDGGNIESFEALLRWNDPQRGLVMPDQFIYIAEDNGAIVPIGNWVFDNACAQLAYWQQTFSAEMKISINLSPVQFRSEELVSNIRSSITKWKVPASSIELELTENSLFENVEEAIKICKELKALGLNLSIDDFGTGYSSLRLLGRLPVDTLKIDKVFIQNMLVDKDDAMIVKTFISLGKGMDLKVVAEGVEQHGQWMALKQGGCDEVQGYYFARPGNVEQSQQLLITHCEVEKYHDARS